MDYSLENLDPERFQELCSALIAKEYDSVQVFPVAQRDGGRDAIAYTFRDGTRTFTLFQVKFVRDPGSKEDVLEWLERTAALEAPKVEALAKGGASQYIILTNARGTAFPAAGSIDRAQTILDEAFPIPTVCWWRDDICRHLDAHSDIKWSFPDILRGTDLLQALIEHGLSEDKQRRSAALRAFLTEQHRVDSDVRFKQIGLHNSLENLFVDIPVSSRHIDAMRYKAAFKRSLLMIQALWNLLPPRGRADDSFTGASQLLLHQDVQKNVPRIVLEGAPGQGKSTVSQYICQFHRRGILGNTPSDLPNLKGTALRIPIRIDCRDLSLWLTQNNPFTSDASPVAPADWHKSLESFLAAMIRHQSGGIPFTPSDLHAVASIAPLLLVFDGLDEVAAVDSRKEVIDAITSGINRLSSTGDSVQTIVTSRPAASSNSPSMPESEFVYFQLEPLADFHIDAFTTKWLAAKQLDSRTSSEIKKVLKSKLTQPHIRELARSPMQLAILLTLIHTRGPSLPDKRTALYDSYVSLFFDRESEKSSVVRDHRDLLIELHQYIGWVLHSEAQSKKNAGRITTARLKTVVETYLTNQGYDPTLTDLLFQGAIDRVVAIVSRIEGTYEFEIQPLREYFAARFLYDSAPPSPPGNERRGTRPDRFIAISRDSFWQNVTRFYSGCYSKGELLSLVEGLQDLSQSEDFIHTNYPQHLCATLLSDWVFSQHPKSQRQLVSFVLDRLGLAAISDARRPRHSSILTLPRECGGFDLVKRCFELLKEYPANDYFFSLLSVIRANAPIDEMIAIWTREARESRPSDTLKWLIAGLRLGVLPRMTMSSLRDLLGSQLTDTEVLFMLVRSGHSRDLECDPCLSERIINTLLDNVTDNTLLGSKGESFLEITVLLFSPSRYSMALALQSESCLSDLWTHMNPPGFAELSSENTHLRLPGETRNAIHMVHEAVRDFAKHSAMVLSRDLAPWEVMIDRIRSAFGERWLCRVLANIAAGVKAKISIDDSCGDLLNTNLSLAKRVRFARMRPNATRIWGELLQSACSADDRAFVILVLLSWCGASVFNAHFEMIGKHLDEMSPDQWRNIYCGVRLARSRASDSVGDLHLSTEGHEGKAVSDRLVAMLGMRLNEECAKQWFEGHLGKYTGSDRCILEMCQRMAMLVVASDASTWIKWLPVIARCHAEDITVVKYFGYRFARIVETFQMPLEIAKRITSACSSYPSELVVVAERRCREAINERLEPIGEIAIREHWFD